MGRFLPGSEVLRASCPLREGQAVSGPSTSIFFTSLSLFISEFTTEEFDPLLCHLPTPPHGLGVVPSTSFRQMPLMATLFPIYPTLPTSHSLKEPSKLTGPKGKKKFPVRPRREGQSPHRVNNPGRSRRRSIGSGPSEVGRLEDELLLGLGLWLSMWWGRLTEKDEEARVSLLLLILDNLAI